MLVFTQNKKNGIGENWSKNTVVYTNYEFAENIFTAILFNEPNLGYCSIYCWW